MKQHIDQFKKNKNLVTALNTIFNKNNVDVYIVDYSEYHDDEQGDQFMFSYEVCINERGVGTLIFKSKYVYNFAINEFVEPIVNVLAHDIAECNI